MYLVDELIYQNLWPKRAAILIFNNNILIIIHKVITLIEFENDAIIFKVTDSHRLLSHQLLK